MQDLRAVIEQAAAKEGSGANLAKALGVNPQRVTEWKNGHRPCPIHTQAQIAELAGIDAKEWGVEGRLPSVGPGNGCGTVDPGRNAYRLRCARCGWACKPLDVCGKPRRCVLCLIKNGTVRAPGSRPSCGARVQPGLNPWSVMPLVPASAPPVPGRLGPSCRPGPLALAVTVPAPGAARAGLRCGGAPAPPAASRDGNLSAFLVRPAGAPRGVHLRRRHTGQRHPRGRIARRRLRRCGRCRRAAATPASAMC